MKIGTDDDMKRLQWELTSALRSAEDHCRRADTAEAAVGENCRTIAKLERELKELKQKRRRRGVTSNAKPSTEKRATGSEESLIAPSGQPVVDPGVFDQAHGLREQHPGTSRIEQ